MTCLGLNGTISLEIPPPCVAFLFEPNASCSRSTANPASATTATVTRIIHRRRISLGYVIRRGWMILVTVVGLHYQAKSLSPVGLSVSGEARDQDFVDQGFYRVLGGWPVGHDGPEDQVAG